VVAKLEAGMDEIPAPAITELGPGFAELLRSQDVREPSAHVQISDWLDGSRGAGKVLRSSGEGAHSGR